MQSSSERASFLVPSNSSISLKQWIRKIMKNSLKLPLFFSNIQYFYWEFQMEFIHTLDVWNWTNLTLKSYIFSLLFCLSECFNLYVVSLYWMKSDQSSSYSKLLFSFSYYAGLRWAIIFIQGHSFLRLKKAFLSSPLSCLLCKFNKNKRYRCEFLEIAMILESIYL